MAGLIARTNTDSITTGHLCDAVATIGGSIQSTVRAGGINVALQGESILPHTIKVGDSCVVHAASINSGAPRIRVGGIPVARVNDSADAGAVSSGHAKIYCGD